MPDRAAWRAWDEALFHSRAARIHARHGEAEAARAAADKAIAALKTAAADQDVDANDWLRLGDGLIEIAPDRFPVFQQAVTALIQDMVLPRRREIEVRLARLQARARHAQGDLAGALEAAQAGHYALGSYGNDDFVEYELPWLLEAGQLDAAGERAFSFLYQVETIEGDGNLDGNLESVLRVIHERLADPAETSFWWPLCVMRACYYPPTLRELMRAAPGTPWTEISETHRALFGSLSPEEDFAGEEICAARFDGVYTAARALAEARAPGHPWIRRLAATQDHARERIDLATQIDMLETVIREGLQDWRTINTLVGARGMQATLKRPPPTLSGGWEAYNFASFFHNDCLEKIWRLPANEQDEAKNRLIAFTGAIYEQARAQMERFFETGKGNRYDACPYIYSRVLNDVALSYRNVGRNAESIELNRRGIAVYPLGEHYYGIFDAYQDMWDPENVVKAAEDLLQFDITHGCEYSERGPTEYVRRVANALYDLQRAEEIPIWLERLTRWERESSGMDEDNLPDYALYSRLIVAFYMAAVDANKDISRRVWQRIAPQVERSQNEDLWGWAADLLRTLGEWQAAIPFYERGLRVEHNEKAVEYLAQCRQKLAEKNAPPKPAKSWWQVWK
jgi:tetratricopeptide (TPR) repeat protein